jgi:ribosomal RNA-processing protein 12
METLFAKIRTQHVSKLDNQRNAASTLLSVEETLREQQTPFTPSAYFAILFALLTEQALGPKQAELREAVVYLLSIVFPELPKPVLRSKYEEILNTLGDIFHQDKESAPIMRSTIGCLQVLLCAQDNRTWELPLTLQAYQALLMCTLDERPKVRRRSQEAIISILSHPISPHIYHPASGVTIEFCHNVLNQCSKSNMNVALHMLHMIKSITFIWSSHSIPKLCELLLKLPKLNNMYLTSASFEVFESLFGLDDYAELESERLSEMLTVILQYKPNFHDAHLMPIWLRVVSLGFTVFAKMEPETCMKSLGQLFNMIFPNMKSEKPEILAATSIALATLVQNCISPQLIHQYEVMVREIVNLVESGLGYQYRIAWTGILALIEALFRRLGRDALPIMSNTLVLLGQLRMEDGFDCKDELDQAIGAAIRSVGPRRVLEILPLNVDQPERKDIVGRAWLLPVLAKYTANTDLYYFINTLIPLGDRLAQRAFSFREAGREIEWKVFLTLAHQVWYLLPGYLTLPIDLPQVWNPAFLERLIGVLQSEPELLTTVCSALRNLVDKYRAFIESPDDTLDGIQVYDLSKEDAQLALNLISQHTKQLLSALLDIYSATDVKSRDSVLKVIQNYMTLLAEEDVNVIYHHVHQLLLKVLAHPEEASQAGLPEAGVLLELIVGMLPYLDVTSLKSVFDMTVGLLNKEDAPLLQKKAHKILWKAVGCERGLAVWQEGLVGIRTHLLAASGQISISAKKYRMLALKALVKLSPVEQLDFVPLILSEAIVCTKEVKEQTRKMAYDLLITMGYRMQEGGLIQMPGDDQQPARTVQASLSEYILMTTAGLAGTTSHMISATIAALSRLVFEFRGNV